MEINDSSVFQVPPARHSIITAGGCPRAQTKREILASLSGYKILYALMYDP